MKVLLFLLSISILMSLGCRPQEATHSQGGRGLDRPVLPPTVPITPRLTTNAVHKIAEEFLERKRFNQASYVLVTIYFDNNPSSESTYRTWVLCYEGRPRIPDADFFIHIDDATGSPRLVR